MVKMVHFMSCIFYHTQKLVKKSLRKVIWERKKMNVKKKKKDKAFFLIKREVPGSKLKV